MTTIYETATVTLSPKLAEQTGRQTSTIDVAYEQGGRHFRRCAACDGFHYVGASQGQVPLNRKPTVVPDPTALRGRIPAELCEYPDARARGQLETYTRRIAAGQEQPPAGWPERRS